ncbi:MAG: phospho-N-acetylmuramoyl-pentapeptide-transferase [Paludibacter sp.]|nr:phospho-N-acetylmuramoyl-pentapeptide-transferase [Bacteroidales bacterium]MCM1068351.1 phospho-N-acetylmuramoyl-pentapeptide-transferase [Prevotella sp.]MCM1354021.1 phospho-N-acetylmuramoyl-pentapeptide-transferase [Bacteroides sp.]MCM1442137.1 phospho-N-acetylmuramoyl-pentapeptide-transferase [Muribaculum sp.]MCM1481970.1 phospho-N-acetylmuramoyl-pentapeptide-transferase [Paludibacter sp.]
MFYHLFTYLDKTFDFPGAGMFQYISFRSGLAFIVALLTATLFGKRIINFLQRKQIGETIRNLGLEGQMQKKGTPTMGGIIIILAILIPVLCFCNLTNTYVLLMIASTLLLGFLGFLDDYIKVFRHNKEGLNGRFKIVGQVGVGLIVGLVMWFAPDVTIRENIENRVDNHIENVEYVNQNHKSTSTTIPFVKNNNLNYADLFRWAGNWQQTLGWIFFILVCIFIVTAVSNGANLTDGLDGLATGTSGIAGVALGILAYVSSNIRYAGFLNIMYIPGIEEMVIFASAFIGATIGFLWFNAYPAQVFMGDTGSLTIGGILGVFAIILHKELLLPILCGVFLVESLSVIIQTTWFKYTKHKTGTGQRIFKMSPLHHHFQKPGNAGIQARIPTPIQPHPENKIVVRFWIVALILAALTILTLKMR